MINKFKDFWDRFVKISFYWLIAFIAIVVFFFVSDIIDTSDDEYSKYIEKQPQKFWICINNIHTSYIQFWKNYNETEISHSQIRDFNNLYQTKKEECYKRYNSYFLLFGNTMTDREITEEVQKLEAYILPEACLQFESLSVDLQIQFHNQFLLVDPCN